MQSRSQQSASTLQSSPSSAQPATQTLFSQMSVPAQSRSSQQAAQPMTPQSMRPSGHWQKPSGHSRPVAQSPSVAQRSVQTPSRHASPESQSLLKQHSTHEPSHSTSPAPQ